MSKTTWAIIAIVIIIVAIIIFIKATAYKNHIPGAFTSTYEKMDATAPVASSNPWKGYYGTV